MNIRGQGGFTIVETLMFFAISALLILIVTVGRGEQTRQIQFTDSIDTLHSALLRLQAERNSTTATGTGTDPDQINYMSEVVFTDGSSNVIVNHCLADRDNGPITPGFSDCSTNANAQNFELKWGTRFTDTPCITPPAGVSKANSALFIRHHVTGLLKTVGRDSTTTASPLTQTEYDGASSTRALWFLRGDGNQCGVIYLNDAGRANQIIREIR